MFGIGRSFGAGSGTGGVPAVGSAAGAAIGGGNSRIAGGGLLEALLSRTQEPVSTKMPVDGNTGPTPVDESMGGGTRSDMMPPGGQVMPQQSFGDQWRNAIASPPSTSTRVPPAWQRWQTGQKMQDAYANNWSPNPMLIRLMGGVGKDSNTQPSTAYNPTTNPSGTALPPGRWSGHPFDVTDDRNRY